METFIKKVEQIKELLKALIIGMPKIPKPAVPNIPAVPSVTTKAKIPAAGTYQPNTPVSPVVDPRTPASKKNPGMAGTRTNQIQKPLLKIDNNGQWNLEE